MTLKIIDNCIPEVMQLQLSNLCTSTEFPWYVMSDATYDNKIGVTSFSHLAMWEREIRSHIFPKLESTLMCIAAAAEKNFNDIFRVRFGLYYPKLDHKKHNEIHTDLFAPHTVALYYVNNSDGPTYFFGDVNQVVEPKMGRLVIFDGRIPHASSCPVINPLRITLNVNFIDSL